jgi:hypothetical protein
MDRPSDAGASGASDPQLVWAGGNDLGAAPQQDAGTGEDNRARAARLLAEAIRVVPAIPFEYARACLLAAFARVVARIEPNRAARLADDAERIARSFTSPDQMAMVFV